ncbi:MAG: hypothetical protein ACRDG2_01615, partial [Actinomycetota bacterium]
MGALGNGVDLTNALRRTASNGFSHLDDVLDERFAAELWDEIRGGPLRTMSGEFGTAKVRMEIDG